MHRVAQSVTRRWGSISFETMEHEDRTDFASMSKPLQYMPPLLLLFSDACRCATVHPLLL